MNGSEATAARVRAGADRADRGQRARRRAGHRLLSRRPGDALPLRGARAPGLLRLRRHPADAPRAEKPEFDHPGSILYFKVGRHPGRARGARRARRPLRGHAAQGGEPPRPRPLAGLLPRLGGQLPGVDERGAPPVEFTSRRAPVRGPSYGRRRGISDGMGLRPAGLDRAADADGRWRSSSASTTSSSSPSSPGSCRRSSRHERAAHRPRPGDGHAHPAAALDRLDHPADAAALHRLRRRRSPAAT